MTDFNALIENHVVETLAADLSAEGESNATQVATDAVRNAYNELASIGIDDEVSA